MKGEGGDLEKLGNGKSGSSAAIIRGRCDSMMCPEKSPTLLLMEGSASCSLGSIRMDAQEVIMGKSSAGSVASVVHSTDRTSERRLRG